MVTSISRVEEVGELPVLRGKGDIDAHDRALRELALVRDHMPFVWRFLRRLGLSPEDADDATQEVFVVAVKKLEQIEPQREKAFLCATAIRIAMRMRRGQNTRTARAVDARDIEQYGSGELPPDEIVDRKAAREFLDQTMSEMAPDLRTAFALFELEGMTVPEIAVVAQVPVGTAASRIRRAREFFQDALKRMHSRKP